MNRFPLQALIIEFSTIAPNCDTGQLVINTPIDVLEIACNTERISERGERPFAEWMLDFQRWLSEKYKRPFSYSEAWTVNYVAQERFTEFKKKLDDALKSDSGLDATLGSSTNGQSNSCQSGIQPPELASLNDSSPCESWPKGIPNPNLIQSGFSD